MSFFNWAFENSLVALGLVILVEVICRLMRHRPALCHALWFLVMLRLLAPPIPWQTPVSKWLQPVTTAAIPSVDTRPVEVSAPQHENLWQSVPATRIKTDAAYQKAAGPTIPSEPAPSNVAWRLSLTPFDYLLWTWMIGALCCWVFQGRRIWRMGRVLSLSQEPNPPFKEIVAATAAHMEMQPPCSRLVERIGSPFIWALRKPILVWPSWQVQQIHEAGHRAVLAHELAHIKRKDHICRWFELLANGILWWNPLFWHIRRRMRDFAELACDAHAIHAFPGSRKALAHALLDAAERGFHPSTVITAMGATAAGRRKLQRRLLMIIKNKTAHTLPRTWMLGLGIALLCLLPGWTMKATEIPQAPAEVSDLDARITHIAQAQIAKAMGERFEEGSQWDKAVEAFQEAARLLPEDQGTLRSLAHAALRAGEPAIAERALRKINDDGRHWISMQMAQALAAQGDRAGALQKLRQAVESGRVKSEIFVDDVFAPLAADPEFNQLMQQSLRISKLRHEKNQDESLENYRQLVEIAPLDASAWGRLGFLAIGSGDLDLAKSAFSTQIELDPTSSTAAYNMACTYSRMGKKQQAIKALRKAIQIGWDDHEHMQQDGDLDAIREMREFKDLIEPLAHEQQLGKQIEDSLESKDYTRALQLLDEADQLSTLDEYDRAWILEKRAMTNYYMEQFGAAAEAFIQSLTHEPDDADNTLYNIACCKALNGETEQAFAYLRVAVEAGFDSADHIREDSDLASLRSDARFDEIARRAAQIDLISAFGAADWDEFMRDFDQKLNEEKLNHKQLKNLSWGLYKGEQWDLGARVFAQMHQRNMGGHTAAYNAACCYALNGSTEQAFKWLQIAIESGFDDADHIRNDSDLRSLREDPRFAALTSELR